MENLINIIITVVSVLTVISLGISTYIFIFFKKLSKGVGRDNLIELLKKLAQIEKENSLKISEIEKEIAEIRKDNLNHIQKVAITRFNPFSEMGGDHSFSLAILNAHLTGFILTGLHTRERTRIYIKKIEFGKCRQDLSKEEKESLEKASS